MFGLARESLERNIVELPSGSALTAGQSQFEALWTRDFCFAAPGLIRLDHGRVVRDHVSRLLAMRRDSDGLIPRLVDSISPAWLRVVHVTAGKVLGGLLGRLPLHEPLHPEYASEHGIESIDSNLLTLRAAQLYVDGSGDQRWWRSQESALLAVFRYYDAHFRDGLLAQPRHADWQDSVRRSGRTLYTNLLYWAVARGLVERRQFGVSPSALEELRLRILRAFYDPAQGLLRSLERDGAGAGAGAAVERADASAQSAARPPALVSLDGNLFALDLGFFEGGSADGPSPQGVFGALRRHPLWPSAPRIPGCATYPDYPAREVAWQVKVVGLRHYHDRLYWSWLIALAAKVARRLGDADEANRILDVLQDMVQRDGVVYEIYEADPPHFPWRSRLYTSERSFSWGAAMIIDALRS